PAPFPTLLADDGARHTILPGMFLGTGVPSMADGAPTASPNGDGDGGISNIKLFPSIPSSIDVTASIAGKLDAWIDLNKNGMWEATEHVLIAVNIPAGTSTVTFTLPTDPRGDMMARFRYSSTGVALPTGLASDGEVNDFLVHGPLFQNPANGLDVTADGFVSPIDALRIINFINRYKDDPIFVNPPNNGN